MIYAAAAAEARTDTRKARGSSAGRAGKNQGRGRAFSAFPASGHARAADAAASSLKHTGNEGCLELRILGMRGCDRPFFPTRAAREGNEEAWPEGGLMNVRGEGEKRGRREFFSRLIDLFLLSRSVLRW